MTAITPGPWKAETIGSGYTGANEKGMCFRIIAPDAGDIKQHEIATIYYKPTIEEAEANACAIAKVPEMLEIIRTIAKHTSTKDLGPAIPLCIGLLNEIEGTS